MRENAPEPSAATGFAVNPLDRLSERRDDAAFVEALAREPATRFVAICQDKPLLRRGEAGYEALWTRDEIAALGRARETALLGRDDARAYFATLLDDSAVVTRETADEGAFVDTRQTVVPGRADVEVRDLRAIAVDGLLPAEATGLLGQAKSLMHWHARHRFCSMCGARSELAAAGWRRECPTCRALHFPRTDPVVIMLAVR
ncbi:MAG TPA: NUDIX-like domain-containing protein, partial [Beijerinckiaceae bacterium]